MSRAAALSDAELVRACRAGDPDAWNELVEPEAADVFQDVFTRVYTRLDSLRDDDALRPWIAQLTRRRCLDALASRGRETQVDEEELGPEEGADLTEVEEAFVVREALAGLSPTCQDMLDRFFARDQSYKTIADELAIPSGTIASRIARCLGRLKQALEPES